MNSEKTRLARILLVEDNEGDVLLTREAFDECKVKTEISVVRNGLEALDFLFQKGAFTNAERPDLILLDINIPIFNGHEVLHKIKTDSKLRKIPVIILSTSTNQKDIDLAYKNRCNGFVTKPIETSKFLKAILQIDGFWLHLSTLSN